LRVPNNVERRFACPDAKIGIYVGWTKRTASWISRSAVTYPFAAAGPRSLSPNRGV
jgi:hypothetical protein